MKHLIVLSILVTKEREMEFKNEQEAIEAMVQNGYVYHPSRKYEYIGAKKYVIANISQKVFFVLYDISSLKSDEVVICKTLEEFTSRIKGTYVDPEEVIYFIDNVFPFMFKGKVINKENDNYAIVSAIGVHYVKSDRIFKEEEDMTKFVAECSMKLMEKEINKEQAFAISVADMVKKAAGSDFDIDLIYSRM